MAYQYECQFGPALEEFRMYYRADSTSPLAQTYYSWMLVYNGKREEALAVIDRMAKDKRQECDECILSSFEIRHSQRQGECDCA